MGKITGYEDVPHMNEKALMKAVSKQPVSVAIEADTFPFQFYSVRLEKPHHRLRPTQPETDPLCFHGVNHLAEAPVDGRSVGNVGNAADGHHQHAAVWYTP